MNTVWTMPLHTDTVSDIGLLVDGLRRFDRLVDLRASRFWRDHRSDVERVLATPLGGGPDGAPMAPPSSLRLVQWNIEKGTRYDGIADNLASHPALSAADVVLLNEVDLGMARSGNRHVARELAERLGMYWAFAPAHIELTKGVGTDLDAPGENASGLQGNAILSRYPLVDARVVPLPVCFEPYHFHEKRYGRRVAIVARVETAAGWMELAGAHLEVRNTPACRARQVRGLVAALEPRGRAVVAGDFNCSTFPRGTFVRTVQGTARLLGNVDRLRTALREPASYEPLFLELARAGLRVHGWNTNECTIVERIDALEDARHLPGPARRLILARLDRLGRRLEMRLDWFAGRGLTPSDPATIPDLMGVNGERVSDHDPIAVDVSV